MRYEAAKPQIRLVCHGDIYASNDPRSEQEVRPVSWNAEAEKIVCYSFKTGQAKPRIASICPYRLTSANSRGYKLIKRGDGEVIWKK